MASRRDWEEKEAAELFDCWARGERGVWSSLVALCAAGVHRRLSTILGDDVDDVDDVLQDTLAELLTNANRFRGQSAGELYAYFMAAALHHAYAELRRRKKLQARTVPIDEYEDLPEPGAEDAGKEGALVSCLEEAIRRLPPEKQRLIAFYYEHNLTAGEIAKASGVTEATTRSRIRLALEALEQLLFDVAGDIFERHRRQRGGVKS